MSGCRSASDAAAFICAGSLRLQHRCNVRLVESSEGDDGLRHSALVCDGLQPGRLVDRGVRCGTGIDVNHPGDVPALGIVEVIIEQVVYSNGLDAAHHAIISERGRQPRARELRQIPQVNVRIDEAR